MKYLVIRLFTLFLPLTLAFPAAAAHYGACSQTARVLKQACIADLKDDYFVSSAICINLSDDEERAECREDAVGEFYEGWGECGEVRKARVEVCSAIGESRYDPDWNPADFVDPTLIGNGVVPNPYLPLVEGNTWTYEGTFLEEDEEGDEEVTETIVVTVTGETKLINGVTCVTVTDTVVEDEEELVEDTDDWFAQDILGRVWYCGEIALNFEFFEGDDPEVAELVDIEGSWKGFRDGARPGILFPAEPVVGEWIRQEVAWGDAEDIIEILSLEGDEEVELEDTTILSCDGSCLVTRDFSPLEPGVNEHKYFKPGVGLILELDPEDPENTRLELKSYYVQ